MESAAEKLLRLTVKQNDCSDLAKQSFSLCEYPSNPSLGLKGGWTWAPTWFRNGDSIHNYQMYDTPEECILAIPEA